VSLNSGQQLAYNIAMSGYNTFITGGAGVGKTYVTDEIIRAFQNKGKNVMVTAPTGIAALNINGVTSHRAFDMPLGALCFDKKSYEPSDEIIYSDVVVIDEISMCRMDNFDFICNKIADANIRRKRLGFNNIQLIVVGDFFQLIPVMTGQEKFALDSHYGHDVGAGFAFYSKFWSMMNFKTIMLTETVRQSDNKFITNLNRVRAGEKAYIDFIYKNSAPEPIRNAITICGKNDEVAAINEQELKRLDSEYIEYKADIQGDVEQSDVNADFVLRLKEGAKVMMLTNHDNYKNGSFGTVEALYDDSIVVQLNNGATEIVNRYEWQVYRYKLEEDEVGIMKLKKELAGTINQFPVKLAYAITIHKSQGQTYEAANISPYSWDCGQLYVAVSRVKSLDKLHFNYEPDTKYIVVSLNVIKFYNSLDIATEDDIKEAEEIEGKPKTELENDFSKLLSAFSSIGE
jgi:ATP-dependent exoDNAse (exonuclease V) alpha subunit